MTVIVDTGPLVAAADRGDPRHAQAAALFRATTQPLVVPAPVTAEADYLIGRRVGPRSRREYLRDLAAGRFEVACLDRNEHAAALAVDERYGDLDLGLADASIVVLCQRYGTRSIATFDHRCFRPLTPLQGGTFRLLPDDDAA